MMDFQLTLPALLRRLDLFASQRVFSSLGEVTYADVAIRSRQLAVKLGQLGHERGDRVATLCWNHHVHLEAYLGVPSAGLVLHTLNPRLHPDDLAYVLRSGGARTLIVDRSLYLAAELAIADVGSQVENLLVVGDAARAGWDVAPPYEAHLAEANPEDWHDPELDENEAAMLCFTSGTTGRPKGVLYSHRAICLHTLALASLTRYSQRVSDHDVVMPVTPMFHIGAWGYPYLAAMVGAELMLGGRDAADPQTILANVARNRVSWAIGVPTVWLRLLELLDSEPLLWNALSSLRAIATGGSAPPRAMIEAFHQHGIEVVQSAGMTEAFTTTATTDLGPIRESGPVTRLHYATSQGIPLPFVETRVAPASDAPRVCQNCGWDASFHPPEVTRCLDCGVPLIDEANVGELEIRSPWTAASYWDDEDPERWTSDGWLRTRDIVEVNEYGFLFYRDRESDLIKSGGEWISSLQLEAALLDHPQIADAAIVGAPDPVYQERPVAFLVTRDGPLTLAEVRDFLGPRFATFWLPDAVHHVDALPMTSVGKIDKRALRLQLRP